MHPQMDKFVYDVDVVSSILQKKDFGELHWVIATISSCAFNGFQSPFQ